MTEEDEYQAFIRALRAMTDAEWASLIAFVRYNPQLFDESTPLAAELWMEMIADCEECAE